MKEIKFTCPMCDGDVRLPVNAGDIQYADCEVCGCTVGMDIDKDEFWLVTVFDSKGFKKNMGRMK